MEDENIDSVQESKQLLDAIRLEYEFLIRVNVNECSTPDMSCLF